MPTIQDVAKRAGVAPITVSRVINNADYIRPATRKKVEDAIAELGYVPNHMARGLRLRQSGTIGLVLTDIINPFFTILARGVEDAASAEGFSIFLCNTDESEEKQMAYLKVLLQKQVDGILLVPARSTLRPLEVITKNKTELVILDRRVPSSNVDIIRCESVSSSERLVSHLIALGHTRIAILTGPQGVSTAEDRVEGYKRALQAGGIDLDSSLIYHGRFSLISGYQMARDAMNRAPTPTALFATNNFIAVGAFNALKDLGLRIPDDISMVTYDDLPGALTINPFFTAMSQPSYEMGNRAAKLLLARLRGERTKLYEEIILPTDLIVRSSSAPPSHR
jgi:LacI family transcriptional regulator